MMKDKADATITTVNLDPRNEQLTNKNYAHQIALEEESMDFIFALNMIEHLTSSAYMISEAKRVLNKEGKLLITTPNATKIN